MKVCFILPILFVLLFFSCKSKIEAKFIIINKSQSDIDSLIIYPNDKNFVGLKNRDSVTYYSNMTSMAKVDGSYLLLFRQKADNKLRRYNFGYYTNGSPLESETRIIILDDTIQVNQFYNRY